ncbi:MAG: nucleotidyltransferase family protein [Nocardioides sp.]|nr:nucleotidyltransferase family protein [Nocardioides sp.]
MTVRGLLLAAGAGRRMGTPKALVDDWLERSVETLHDGGCVEVTVVLGAAVDEAVERLEGLAVATVVAEDWADGMGASLRAGLASTDADHSAVLVTLVDLPDVGADVVRRVLADSVTAASRSRATYDGEPGHPVLIGRDHWAGVIETATGDKGARAYLAGRPVDLVECGDLATGRDVDSR